MRILFLVGLLFCSISLLAASFTCPMHPHYISHEFGTCPICGMDLVEVRTSTPLDHGDHGPDPDRLAITISPELIQNMGVRTEKVAVSSFGRMIRSYGVVTENQRETSAIASRVSGWVASLEVTAIGDQVKAGDLLFHLYSPDLIAAQEDYLAALQSQSSWRIQSVAQRLESLGVAAEVLAALRSRRQKFQNVPFYATHSGVVSQLSVRDGSYVQPGEQIAMLQSYDTVWVQVSVAEKDMQYISLDSLVKVTFPNLGARVVTSTVDYVYPVINPDSRTGQIRLVLDNEDGLLKPGSYADVVFETQAIERLSVPSEGILTSSSGDYVVLDLGQGRFQPRQVRLGIFSADRTEVIDGLEPGDVVVVSSHFLIDSESSLREVFRKMDQPRSRDPASSPEHFSRYRTPTGNVDHNATEQ